MNRDFIIRVVLRARDELSATLIKAQAQIEAFNRMADNSVNRLTRIQNQMNKRIQPHVDTSKADRGFDHLEKRADEIGRKRGVITFNDDGSIRRLGRDADRTGKEVEHMGRSTTTARRATRAFSNDLRDGESRLQAFNRALHESRLNVAKIDNQLRGIVVLAALGFAQQLTSALVGLGGAAISAGSSLIAAGGAIGGAFAAGIAQAIPLVGLLVAAFHRVSQVMDAVKQQNLVQQQESAKTGKGHKDQADAADRLANANDGLKSSEEAVAQAHRGVHDAQTRVHETQLALNKARADGVRQLQDLRFEERAAALAAKGAALDQAEAQDRLQGSIQQGQFGQVGRAQLDVQQSLLDRQRTAAESTRSIEDRRHARGSIENLDSVIQAKKDVQDANKGVQDARREVEKAEQAVTKARRGLDGAKRSTQESAADQLASAGKLNFLLANLSTAERELFHALQRFQDTFKKQFRPITDIIIRAFTFGVNRGITLLHDEKLIGGFKGLAEQIASSFKRITNAFTVPTVLKQFERFTKEAARNLKELTPAAVNVGRAFLNIAEHGGPTLRLIVGWVKDIAHDFRAWSEDSSKVDHVFIIMNRHLTAWKELIGATFHLLLSLIGVSQSSGLKTVSDFTKQVEKATRWIDTHGNKAKGFFADSRRALSAMGDVVVAIAKAALALFDPKKVESFAKFLTDVVLPAFKDVFGVLGDITHLIISLLSLKGVSTFVKLTTEALLFGVAIKKASGLVSGLLGIVVGTALKVKGIGAAFEALAAGKGIKAALTAFKEVQTAAAGASRLGGGAGGGIAGKVLSKANPVPVFVVNQTGGIPGTKGGAPTPVSGVGGFSPSGAAGLAGAASPFLALAGLGLIINQIGGGHFGGGIRNAAEARDTIARADSNRLPGGPRGALSTNLARKDAESIVGKENLPALIKKGDIAALKEYIKTLRDNKDVSKETRKQNLELAKSIEAAVPATKFSRTQILLLNDALKRFGKNRINKKDIIDPAAADNAAKEIDNLKNNGAKSMHDLRKKLRTASNDIEQGFKHGSKGWSEAMTDNFSAGIKSVKELMNSGVVSNRRGMREMVSITKDQMRAVKGHLKDLSADGKDALAHNFALATSAVRQEMHLGGLSTKKGMEYIRKLMISELGLFNIDPHEAKSFLNRPAGEKTAAGTGRGAQVGAYMLGKSGDRGQDNIPIMLNNTPILAASGEVAAVFNYTQQAALDQAVAHTYGLQGGLQQFFNTFTRPHSAAGGDLIVSPSGVTRAGGHGAKAAPAKADSRGDQMLHAANAIDAHHYKYQWGGGHAKIGSPTGGPGVGYDCSGAVSAVLHSAGLLNSPRVAQGFIGFGESGKGDASIVANSGHVYMVLGGKAWGTSGENPGGGAGWVNGYTYRQGFKVSHVPGLNLPGGAGGGQNVNLIPHIDVRMNRGGMIGKGINAIRASGGYVEALAEGGMNRVRNIYNSILRAASAAEGGDGDNSGQPLREGMIRGGVSTFGPPGEGAGGTAYGKSSADPGIAVNPKGHPGSWNDEEARSYANKLMRVSIQSHSGNLRVIDKGPAIEGRMIDVTGAGSSAIGIPQKSFPTDATGTAELLAHAQLGYISGGMVRKGHDPHGGPHSEKVPRHIRVINAMQHWANARLGLKYNYGGGHGGKGGYDCSSFVTGVLHAGGFGGGGDTIGLSRFGQGGGGKYVSVGVLNGRGGAKDHTAIKVGKFYYEMASRPGSHRMHSWPRHFGIMRHPKGYQSGGFVGSGGAGETEDEANDFLKLHIRRAATGGILGNPVTVGGLSGKGGSFPAPIWHQMKQRFREKGDWAKGVSRAAGGWTSGWAKRFTKPMQAAAGYFDGLSFDDVLNIEVAALKKKSKKKEEDQGIVEVPLSDKEKKRQDEHEKKKGVSPAQQEKERQEGVKKGVYELPKEPLVDVEDFQRETDLALKALGKAVVGIKNLSKKLSGNKAGKFFDKVIKVLDSLIGDNGLLPGLAEKVSEQIGRIGNEVAKQVFKLLPSGQVEKSKNESEELGLTIQESHKALDSLDAYLHSVRVAQKKVVTAIKRIKRGGISKEEQPDYDKLLAAQIALDKLEKDGVDERVDLLSQIYETQQQILQVGLDDINKAAERKSSGLERVGRIASLFGNTAAKDSVDSQQIDNMRNHASLLAAYVAIAGDQLTPDQKNDINDQIDEINATIVEATVARFQAATDAINDSSARAETRLGLQDRLDDVNNRAADRQEKNGDTVGASLTRQRILDSRRNTLEARGAEITGHRDQLQNQLNFAIMAGWQDSPFAKALSDQIDELNTQLVENQGALDDNTQALHDEQITQIKAAIDLINATSGRKDAELGIHTRVVESNDVIAGVIERFTGSIIDAGHGALTASDIRISTAQAKGVDLATSGSLLTSQRDQLNNELVNLVNAGGTKADIDDLQIAIWELNARIEENRIAIIDNTETILDLQRARLDAEISLINAMAAFQEFTLSVQQRLSELNETRASILDRRGDTVGADRIRQKIVERRSSFLSTEGTIIQTQLDGLRSKLAEGNRIGITADERRTLEQQIGDLVVKQAENTAALLDNTQAIIDIKVKIIEDSITLINNRTAVKEQRLGFSSRISDLRETDASILERRGNIIQADQLRVGILEDRRERFNREGSILSDQKSLLENQLSKLISTGAPPEQIESLKLQIEELTVKIAENKEALLDNTQAIIDAKIKAIQDAISLINTDAANREQRLGFRTRVSSLRETDASILERRGNIVEADQLRVEVLKSKTGTLQTEGTILSDQRESLNNELRRLISIGAPKEQIESLKLAIGELDTKILENSEAIKDNTQAILDAKIKVIQDRISLINQTASNAETRVNFRDRLNTVKLGTANLLQAAGSPVEAEQLRKSVLQTTSGTLASTREIEKQQLGSLNNQLASLTAIGAPKEQIEALKIQIGDLTTKLAENAEAILENTQAIKDADVNIRQARIDQISGRQSFLGGVIGSLTGIAAGVGENTGNTTIQNQIDLTKQARGTLSSTSSSLRNQLSAGFGVDLGNLHGTDFTNAVSNLDLGTIESSLDAAAKNQFEALINAIIDNEASLTANTTQLKTLTGQMTVQTFSTSAWQWFRNAIFNGAGGLLPQFMAPSLAGGGEIVKEGLVNLHPGEVVTAAHDRISGQDIAALARAIENSRSGGDTHVNITSPTEVADADVLAAKMAWKLSRSPTT